MRHGLLRAYTLPVVCVRTIIRQIAHFVGSLAPATSPSRRMWLQIATMLLVCFGPKTGQCLIECGSAIHEQRTSFSRRNGRGRPADDCRRPGRRHRPDAPRRRGGRCRGARRAIRRRRTSMCFAAPATMAAMAMSSPASWPGSGVDIDHLGIRRAEAGKRCGARCRRMSDQASAAVGVCRRGRLDRGRRALRGRAVQAAVRRCRQGGRYRDGAAPAGRRGRSAFRCLRRERQSARQGISRRGHRDLRAQEARPSAVAGPRTMRRDRARRHRHRRRRSLRSSSRRLSRTRRRSGWTISRFRPSTRTNTSAAMSASFPADRARRARHGCRRWPRPEAGQGR